MNNNNGKLSIDEGLERVSKLLSNVQQNSIETAIISLNQLFTKEVSGEQAMDIAIAIRSLETVLNNHFTE